MLFYREIVPHTALASFVKCFWIWRADSAQPWANRESILPDGCTELLFDFTEPMNQGGADPSATSEREFELAGQLSFAREFRQIGAINMLGVRFHAHGIFPFLGHPLFELTDRVVSLNEVWRSLSKDLSPVLLEAPDDRRRIQLVERALLSLVRKQELHPDFHVRNAVECINANGGLITVEALACEVGLGRRQLERKFALQVGISPKLYTRVLRLRRIMSLVQHVEEYDWARVVADCHFYDQSHLLRDFKALSGQTPSEFFDSNDSLARLFTSGGRKTHFYNTS